MVACQRNGLAEDDEGAGRVDEDPGDAHKAEQAGEDDTVVDATSELDPLMQSCTHGAEIAEEAGDESIAPERLGSCTRSRRLGGQRSLQPRSRFLEPALGHPEPGEVTGEREGELRLAFDRPRQGAAQFGASTGQHRHVHGLRRAWRVGVGSLRHGAAPLGMSPPDRLVFSGFQQLLGGERSDRLQHAIADAAVVDPGHQQRHLGQASHDCAHPVAAHPIEGAHLGGVGGGEGTGEDGQAP
jgi:hypothetical protein